MKKLTRIFSLGLCLVTLSSFCGCAAEKESGVIDKKEKDTPVIGFSMATYKEDRWLQDREIFTAKAKQAGYDIIVSNANNNAELQFKQVSEMIESGIDVLVIVPDNYESASACVDLAKKNNVPVISYDRLVGNSDVDVYVSFDNFRVGELLAESMLDAAPGGRYLLVKGSESDANCKMIYEGVMNVLKPYIDSGKVEIVSETWADNWLRELSYSFVAEQLSVNGSEIDGIIAFNDSLAWGAIDALSEAQLAGKIKVVGQDADLSACQRIVDGTQLMTIYKPIPDLSDETISLCGKLVKGEEIQYEDTINNGRKDVPAIYLDVVAVTKDNIDDTVIRDGFHLKDEVYREN